MTIESISREEAATRFCATWAGEGQAFFVASVRSPADTAQTAEDAYIRIAEALREHQLEIVHERIFGSLSMECSVMAARQRAFRTCGIAPDNPLTYIQGNPPWGEGFAGLIIHAVHRGNGVWSIWDGDIPCGRRWRHKGSTYIMLQNINGQHDFSRESESRPIQAWRMLDRADRILRENGASYGDVVRTWFYLSDILDWYAAFNKVRNEKYGEFGIMPGPDDTRLLLPASTGISGDTPSRAGTTMDLIAIMGESSSRLAVKQLTNIAQLDAFRYESAFSRGAVIHESDVSLIQVSGTAAIDQQGKTQFVDDIHGQITCTFEKLEKLMDREGASLKDIAAATVFVKRPEHASVFWEMVRKRGLEEFPGVCIVADVCREELLFEIDGEAVVGRKGFEGKDKKQGERLSYRLDAGRAVGRGNL